MQRGTDIKGVSDYNNNALVNSVAISSDSRTVVIGSTISDLNHTNHSGHLSTYHWDGSVWKQLGNDVKGTAGVSIGYSASISCDGKTISFGDTSGHVNVYSWDKTAWNQVGSSISITEKAQRNLYRPRVSLSCDGRTIAAGAVGNSNDGFSSGRARVFKWDVDEEVWSQVGGDINGGKASEESESSLSLSSDGTKVIIGVLCSDNIATDTDAARIYSIGTGSESQNN